MTKFHLGGQVFPSKSAAREHLWTILRTTPADTRLTNDAAILVADLLYSGRHPQSIDKIGMGVEYIIIRKLAWGGHKNKTKCLVVHRIDGTEMDFPYLEAFAGEPDIRANAMAALWAEINDQYWAFDLPTEPASCGVCEKPVALSEAYLDCTLPTFEELATQFAQVVGGWENLYVAGVGPYKRVLASSITAEVWRTYYSETAKFRPVHEDCRPVRVGAS